MAANVNSGAGQGMQTKQQLPLKGVLSLLGRDRRCSSIIHLLRLEKRKQHTGFLSFPLVLTPRCAHRKHIPSGSWLKTVESSNVETSNVGGGGRAAAVCILSHVPQFLQHSFSHHRSDLHTDHFQQSG
ncbi:hypothetical protein JZ751_022145 [Albula glossodonta]|uniref:Uncharacterized protein n=1 Tax=Albula glossodonta TaxID=121402 RepID=A0A8T2NJ45_9TELE|nr:hypothetical protein JZ751_022145 [Albula glossodonta]